jgi:hypothetical protein
MGIKAGLLSRVSFYTDMEGKLIAGIGKMTEKWVDYCTDLLNKDTTDELVDNIGVENDILLPPPTLEEVKKQIKAIKKNGAPGVDNITGEMIKYGGDELLKYVFALIYKIWHEEKMPEQRSTAVICSIHKKGSKMDCNNYRGIMLLSIVYKVMSTLTANKLASYAKKVIGEYHTDFR